MERIDFITSQEHAMKPRLNFYQASPDAIKAMLALEAAVGKLGLHWPGPKRSRASAKPMRPMPTTRP